MRGAGDIGNNNFPKYGGFLSIKLQFCGILHHMGNAWVFQSMSHSKEKCSKTHPMGTAYKINTHTFPKIWVLPRYPMVYFIPWKIHEYSHQSPITWEYTAKPILWGEPGKYLAKIATFYGSFSSIRLLSLSHGKCIGFAINFSFHGKTQQSQSYGRELKYSYIMDSFITTTWFLSSKPELRFCKGFNFARGSAMTRICDNGPDWK